MNYMNPTFRNLKTQHSWLTLRHLGSLSILVIMVMVIFCQLSSVCQASSNVSFPDPLDLHFENERLTLKKTGESIRKVFFIKVYRIAHYTDENSGKDHILDYNGPKAVSMVFLRKIDGPRIQHEVKKAIRDRISDVDWGAVEASTSEFCQPFASGEVNKGDEYSVIWFPDGRVVNKFNGEDIGGIQNPLFARALWNIWVGQNSLVDPEDLLGEWFKEK